MTHVWIDVLLLANLAEQPCHGYELRRRVEHSTGYALSNNSLYPALRRFTEAGAVTRTQEPQEGRPPRHVYELTDVGRELLHDMLADLPEELARDEPEFMSRLAFFDWLTPDERLRVLDARRSALKNRRERIAAFCAQAEPGGWSHEALRETSRRIHAELDWLDRVRTGAPDGPPRKEEIG